MFMAIDPVCGMEVDENGAKERSIFEGRTFYFCSQDCREEFDEAPEEYVGEGDLRTGT
jgi:YHS domain-containing protein